MDVGPLASAAVGFLASYLTQVGAGLGDRVRQSVEDGIYQSITGRLRQSKRGKRALEVLELDPSDSSALNEAGSALEAECSEDPSFAADLERAIHFIQANRNDMRMGPSGPDVTVGSGSKMKMRNSPIAGGNVDQSRRIHLTTNGLMALVAFVAAIFLSTGAVAGYYLLPSQESEIVASEEVPPALEESTGPASADDASTPAREDSDIWNIIGVWNCVRVEVVDEPVTGRECGGTRQFFRDGTVIDRIRWSDGVEASENVSRYRILPDTQMVTRGETKIATYLMIIGVTLFEEPWNFWFENGELCMLGGSESKAVVRLSKR